MIAVFFAAAILSYTVACGFAGSFGALFVARIGAGAMFTDHVFHDPRSVGRSMSAVALPTALIAFALLWWTRTRRGPVLMLGPRAGARGE